MRAADAAGGWTGAGSASLTVSPGSSFQATDLSADIAPDQIALPLYVDRRHGALTLFAWIGDPDDGRRYSPRRA